MKHLLFILTTLVVLGLPTIGQTAETDVGIVLLHGKWAEQPNTMTVLASTLESKGFKVATPMMPWSDLREYDADYPSALAEIEAAANSLRKQGAKRIIIGGHSFGANAAIAYAGSGRNLDGVMAFGPGHTPDLGGFRFVVSRSVRRAKEMIADGKGDSKASFGDVNQGLTKSIHPTANVYFSFFDPEGLAAMPKSAAAIPHPVPFLWVIGTLDRLYGQGEEYVFGKAPKHPDSKYLIVRSDHYNTPSDAALQIVEWITSLGY